MGSKKKKKGKKPAVGKPAAGSNNKGAKKAPQQSKNDTPNKNKNKDKIKNDAVLRAEKKAEEQKKLAEKVAKQKMREEKEAELRRKQEAEIERRAAEKAAKQKEKKKTSEKSNSEIKSFTEKPKKTKNVTKDKKTVEKTKSVKKRKSLKETYEDFSDKYNVGKIAVVSGAVLSVIIISTVIIAAIIGRNYSVPDAVRNEEYKGRMESETVAFDMDISESLQKSLADGTKVKGDKRAFEFFINKEIVINEYDDPALIEFGSVESNNCDLLLFIVDNEDRVIYQSKGVSPGKEIRSVNFFEELPYGINELTVAVLGYDSETYEKVGMQTAKIRLKIGVD